MLIAVVPTNNFASDVLLGVLVLLLAVLYVPRWIRNAIRRLREDRREGV